MSNKELIDPPKWAITLLKWICPNNLYEGILGDLLEQFDEEVNKTGTSKAKIKFIWTSLRFIHPYLLFKNKIVIKLINMGMFTSHLTVAMRSMKKYKFYSFINILGLTLAFTFVFLSFLFIDNEISYDSFHENGNNIYRLYNYRQDADSGIKSEDEMSGVTPVPLSKDLADAIPGITNYTRYGSSSGTVLINRIPFEETICMVDPGFLKMFSFPMIAGLKNALDEPDAIILSKEHAEKYFKTSNPIGNEIQLILNDSTKTFVVKGVIDNKKNISSIPFDILIPFERMEIITPKRYMESYNVAFVENWVSFDQAIDESMTEIMTSAVDKYSKSDKNKWMVVAQPLNEVHFDNNIIGLALFTNPQKIWILVGLSLLVLVIAIINFITLSTGHSMHRVKEIGLRKTLGAAKSSLKVQLIFESFVITLIAAFFGIIITYFALPVFNQLIEGTVIWDLSIIQLLFIISLSFIVGLLSGGVQASILVKFNPLTAIKGSKIFVSKESWLNQGLIIIQFTLSVLLIIGTLVMRSQMNYIQQKDLGFNEERLIEISLHASDDNQASKLLIERFKSVSLKNPNILSIGGTMNSFNEPWTQLSFSQIEGPSEDVYFNQIDEDYIDAMQIELITGEKFKSDGGISSSDIIVNEALVKHFEWDSPLDKQIPGKNFKGNHRIIGVVKDFHFSSLHNKIEPIILAIDAESISSGITGLNTYSWPANLYRIVVRISPGDLMSSVSFLEDAWKQINPNKPFTYNFVDDALANNYKEEARWRKVIDYASIFAIAIAWMGLLGLTRLSVQKRTKEIGIRKVLGSSALNVTKSLSLRFLILVLFSNIIAWPVAWFSMNKWLESFSYRISLNANTFVGASVAILLVVLLSVGWQSYKAANANPVDSLKYE